MTYWGIRLQTENAHINRIEIPERFLYKNVSSCLLNYWILTFPFSKRRVSSLKRCWISCCVYAILLGNHYCRRLGVLRNNTFGLYGNCLYIEVVDRSQFIVRFIRDYLA